MKVLLLSDLNSSHTQKWAVSLKEAGIITGLFSLTVPKDTWSQDHGIPLFLSGLNCGKRFIHTAFAKPFYPLQLPFLRRAIKTFRPDIIHAHYATSYGLLGAWSGSRPFIISAWGSDILDFPGRSRLNQLLLKKVLRKADAITATSHYLAGQTKRFTDKSIEVIPFGVPVSFGEVIPSHSPFSPGDIVVGAVKAMEAIYGIDASIRAFYKVHSENPQLPLKLLLVGGGSQLERYRSLVDDLGISAHTWFTGAVPYHDVGGYHAQIDIFINLSHYESFGVSVLEAAMAGRPAIVSSVGGLPELVEDGITGFLVPPKDPDAAAAAILTLATDQGLRSRMGNEARIRVQDSYTLEAGLDKMIHLYHKLSSR